MKQIYWTVKHFDELTLTELYAILQLRSAVFVLEQNCLYQDMDNKDKECYHLMAWDEEKEQLAAYTRIVPAGISFKEPSIGRVLTSSVYRGMKLGRELMENSIEFVQSLYPNRVIRIGAQVYLNAFYTSLGFEAQGDHYDEDGIEHVEMIYTPIPDES